jgi:hypothetical protein
VIRLLTAQTREADDGPAAAAEILAGLREAGPLSRYACGLVHCADSFVETGAMSAVCRALPFPTAGVNTILHSSSLGTVDSTLLTVTVLTSPDVRMSAALSEPMDDEVAGPCEALYSEALRALRDRPSAGIVFGPILPGFPSGEMICYELDAASGGMPLFGCLASDIDTGIRSPQVLFDGTAWPTRAALVLLGSSARPKFSVFPVSARKTLRGKAVVTDSEAHLVRQINGLPVLDFLESLGLCREGRLVSTHMIPFFLERGGGRPPIVRAVMEQTADGAILLGGKAPAGSTLGIGAMDISHILDCARRAAAQIRLSSPDATILYSCIARNIGLGLNYTMEIETLRRDLAGCSPYVLAYSMGEICPLVFPDGKWRNEYHNMSLISMSLS